MAKTPWKSNEQIEEEKLIESLQPTPDEVKDSELEIKMLTLLIEMGVVE